MKILHVIPRWIGGGPERGILEIARHDRARPGAIERRVVVLDKPVSAPLLVMARRLGIALVTDTDPDRLAGEIEAADIVEITYWNHPLLLDLLRKPLPAARFLVRSAIAGNTLPHVLFGDLVAFPDAWVLSAPPGHGAVLASHAHVTHIPALADMTRLAGYAARPHDGIRIAYLGGMFATKLHPDFADIVAQTSGAGIRFDLFGDSDAATLESLRSALTARDVLERVAFHGHVENIADAFAEADIFAYPLTPGSYVTSEKALQEAMWVGVPPVLLEGTAASGWINHGVTGFIARDIADFARILALLSADPTLRRRIGEAARAEARRRFDPSRNALAMAEVLSGLLLLPKRTHPPLPGAGLSAADRFLQSLGDAAPLFLEIVDVASDLRPPSAAWNPEILLRGEGGILHYANTFPDDDRLLQWADALGRPRGRARACQSRRPQP